MAISARGVVGIARLMKNIMADIENNALYQAWRRRASSANEDRWQLIWRHKTSRAARDVDVDIAWRQRRRITGGIVGVGMKHVNKRGVGIK